MTKLVTQLKGQMDVNQARQNDECRGAGSVVVVASGLCAEIPPQSRVPRLHLLQADMGDTLSMQFIIIERTGETTYQ
jgi:hypothetical protein